MKQVGLSKEQEKNSWEVLKFLESWHSIEPSLMGSDEPYDHKAKGSSRPPCSDNALDLMHANAEARTILTPILERLEGTVYGGVVNAIRYDPSAIPNWRAAQGRPWRMVRGLCKIVARSVAKHHDGPDGPYRLKVAVTRREIEDALRDPREVPPGQARMWVAQDAYRIIDGWRRSLVETQGFSEAAAVGYLMDEGFGKDRITAARKFVEGERKGSSGKAHAA